MGFIFPNSAINVFGRYPNLGIVNNMELGLFFQIALLMFWGAILAIAVTNSKGKK